MFGSLGWGLAMFFIGIALDHSTAFPGHPCQAHDGERNYTICFAVFSVLMCCALITATQFKVTYILFLLINIADSVMSKNFVSLNFLMHLWKK